jgi:hypothetical protein
MLLIAMSHEPSRLVSSGVCSAASPRCTPPPDGEYEGLSTLILPLNEYQHR